MTESEIRTLSVDLSKTPTDAVAAEGYDALYALWKSNYDAFAEGIDIPPTEFEMWVKQIPPLLTAREKRFFSQPFPDNVKAVRELLQAKTGARVYIMLMDRQGFKVSTENGGLG